jgi:hypothetical protein
MCYDKDSRTSSYMQKGALRESKMDKNQRTRVALLYLRCLVDLILIWRLRLKAYRQRLLLKHPKKLQLERDLQRKAKTQVIKKTSVLRRKRKDALG